MARRPLIGLTAYTEQVRYLAWDVEASLLPSTYVDAIVRSGGVPVLLPPVNGATDAVADTLDGLVLSGGGDVDASQYGEQPHRANRGVRPARDAFELALLRAMLARDLPARCRRSPRCAVSTTRRPVAWFPFPRWGIAPG